MQTRNIKSFCLPVHDKVRERRKEDLDEQHGGGTVRIASTFKAQELRMWTHPHEDCAPIRRVELSMVGLKRTLSCATTDAVLCLRENKAHVLWSSACSDADVDANLDNISDAWVPLSLAECYYGGTKASQLQ